MSLKSIDYYLGKAKKSTMTKLSSLGNVITSSLCPYENDIKKTLGGKKAYIKNAVFNVFISLTLGLSRLGGGNFPFGLSLLCSFTDSGQGIFSFAGALASCMFTGSLIPVRMTVYLLIFLLRKTFTAGKYNEKLHYKISVCAFFSIFLWLAGNAGGRISGADIFEGIFFLTVSCSGAYLFHAFFKSLQSGKYDGIYILSLYAVFACTIPAFTLFSPFGINLSLIYASVLVLFFSKAKGPVYGCVAGFVFGFLSSDPLYCAPLGVAGLVCGYIFAKSFTVSCISFTASSFFCALYLFGFSCLSDFFPFVFSASLLFMIIGMNTPKLLCPIQEKTPIRQKQACDPKKDTSFGAVSDSLSGLSSILYKFAEHLKSPSYAETGDIFDNAFSEVCSKCSMNSMCYAKRECNFEKVREDVIESLRGDVLKEEKLSVLLLHKCIRSGELCDYINRHYSELRFLTMKANRTGTVACLYNSMSHLIRTTEKEEWAKNVHDIRLEKAIGESLRKIGVDFTYVSCLGSRTKQICVHGIRADKIPCSSADLSMYLSKQCKTALSEPTFDISDSADMVMKLSRREIISCEYAKCCAAKKNEEVCGDTVSFFDSNAGYFYSLISDGMGSGKTAAATSRLTCVFLEKLLCAGTKKNVCLELLNNLLISKNDETFSSVDLLEIDKLNSSACFIKAGAASSFILRGMKLYKIRSETPPVGIIHSFSAESTSFSLEKGDVIIMLSDGVIGSDSDEKWLSELIRLDTKDEPALLCSMLIERAKQRHSGEDDMSALVIKII